MTLFQAQAELRQVLQSITDDLATAYVQGLRDVNMKSDKFTKFSGRTHDRMDCQQTIESEIAAITSVESYKSDASGTPAVFSLTKRERPRRP